MRKTPRFLVWATGNMMMPFTDTENTGKNETDMRNDDDLIFMKK